MAASNLARSLEAAFTHPACASDKWLENSNIKLNHLFPSPCEGNSSYWVDDGNDKLSLSFPAIIDMNGKHSRLDPYFSLKDRNMVFLIFCDTLLIGSCR